LFSLLDDTRDGTINNADEGSLGVRFGYMQFYDCNAGSETETSYTSGCIQIPGSGGNRRYIGSRYSQIYCNSNTSCNISSTGTYSIGAAKAWGGTPLANSLNVAKIYLGAHKAGDIAAECRQKFVILISDGADTFACNGNGQEDQPGMDRRRRESVARAKALHDDGYKVFVIGFGADMPEVDLNTLNWMAYYGGTENPNVENMGDTGGYDPSLWTSCGPSSTVNDPGTKSLRGYAFLASNAAQLTEALTTAISIIRQANYSFSQSSVQSVRIADENHLYEGSFEPVDNDSFWKGHLRKYEINADGTVGSVLWDSGEILQSTPAADRTIFTVKGGTLTGFTAANITAADVGVTTDALRDSVVGYVRGEQTYNPEQNALGQVWKLGDVFRSTPITVGTPSPFYEDKRDLNNQWGAHRTSHHRSSVAGNRLIVAGANDGQFHAFKTGDGTEAWSFVPPNFLTKLRLMTHGSHPTSLSHQYFVDGPVTVADVWLGTGDGRAKTADWKTVLIFGQGRGAVDVSWSSSASCDAGLSPIYSTDTPFYCGFWAFDLNDSLDPVFMWRFDPDAARAPYVGDPWSKMMPGRVRYREGGQEVEKWVGFVGAGYNAGNCKASGCDPRGKGFFVVDLNDGSILWSYTRSDNIGMDFSLAAPPAIVDTDNDGFIDTVYVGDLGANMWRFKFCRGVDMPDCSANDWAGSIFFNASSGQIRPIYTSAAVARDSTGNLWVYWGTGDKTDPTAANAQEHFYGVKDNDRTGTFAISDLDNITQASGTYNPGPGRPGYRIQFAGQGEKLLADPTVFGGIVYFTTFTPAYGDNPCEQGGSAELYAVQGTTGGGALKKDGTPTRSMAVGVGIPSAPVLSLSPDGSGSPDLYVTTSGGDGMSASTQRVDITPPGVSSRTNMLYWWDRRIR